VNKSCVKIWGSNKTNAQSKGFRGYSRFSYYAISTALLTLAACSQNSSTEKLPLDSFTAVPTDIRASISESDLSLMRHMGEEMPANGQLIWLKKDVWLGKKIWISLGVERSSLTGLAMSVMGYIPAEVTKVGGELVLLRQNKGLFGGSALGPDLLINSYPIVADRGGRMLVDFSQAKSPYGLSTIGFYDGMSENEELQPRVEFTRAAQTTENRVSFLNVLVAKSPEALYDSDSQSAEALAALDPYSLAVTMRTDWFTEIESPEFNPLAVTDNVFGFFIGFPQVTEGGTAVEEYVNKINTNKPMNWTLSSNTPAEYVEAVQQGVLAWNQAFGKDVLTAKVGSPEELSYTNPETSNVVWDDNQAVGMAFANMRTHPYTGEIVQAQVYMSGSMWAESGKMIHKLRGIEKQIRAELAQNPVPTPDTSTEEATDDTSGGSNSGDGQPRDRSNWAKVKKELNKVLRDSNALIAREENASKKLGVRRFVLGWNAGLAKSFAKNSSSCLKLTPAGSELRNTQKSLEKLLASVSVRNEVVPNGEVIVQTEKSEAPASEISHNPYPPESMTVDQFSKNVVRGVVMHEVGHAIGLRHNFIGSMESNDDPFVESASIMDYNDLVVDAAFEKPGTNDNVVIKGVYGTADEKANLKDIRFCSDEIAGMGVPGCSRFDYGKNNLEGFKVQQEADLNLALRMLSVGQMEMGFNLLDRAIMSNVPVIDYIVFPTQAAAGFLRDRNFVEKQKQALELFRASQNMLGADFPPSLKAVYAQILIQAMAASLSEKALESEMYSEAMLIMIQALEDPSSAMELTTRLAALKGIHNVQDMSGRLAMIKVRDMIVKRLADTSVDSQNPLHQIPENKMEDEEVLTAIQNILNKGYFKEAK